MLGDINQTVDYEEGFKKLYEKNIEGKYNINQIIRTDDTFDYYRFRRENRQAIAKELHRIYIRQKI